MDKRHLHHYWTKLRVLNPWYLLVVCALLGVISVFALRQNNLTMLRLRNDVYKADEQNGDIEGALRRLREYVHAHMHTELASGDNAIRPPIQLKHRYERLTAAEKERVSQANTKIYSDAQAECERLFPVGLSGRNRIPCIEDYVASRALTEVPVPDDLYKFDFISPRWSPDLAGWSLVLTGLSFAGFVLFLGVDYWLKRYLRR